MATNITQKDKTLQEVIDWCADLAQELCADINCDYYANFMQADALGRVIRHCQSMLGSGSIQDQSEDTKK